MKRKKARKEIIWIDMRLVRHEGTMIVRFTFPWEVQYLLSLAEEGMQWVPFSMSVGGPVVGEIESRTHTVRLREGVEMGDRQVVFLTLSERKGLE